LEYAFDYGEVEEQILRDCRMSRTPIPERIANKPKLAVGNDLYYQAFIDLDSDRQHGMSAGRIPWTSMMRYAKFFQFDAEQIEILFAVVAHMDVHTLRRSAKK
jgi:hypothetical protein